MNIEKLIDQHYELAAELEALAEKEQSVAKDLQRLVYERFMRRCARHNAGLSVWPPMLPGEIEHAEYLHQVAIQQEEWRNYCQRLAKQAPTQTTWGELHKRL
jgi:hypothetical protein